MLDSSAPASSATTNANPDTMGVPSPLKLSKDLQSHYRRMEWLRLKCRENMKEYTGRHYGETVDGQYRPSNIIFESVQALRPSLAMEELEPTVKPKIITKDLDAQVFKSRLTRVVEEQDVAMHCNQAIDDALFAGIGIILVMQTQTDQVCEIDSSEYHLGETVVRSISVDDMVIDADARSMREARMIGDKRRVSRRQCVESRCYGRDPEEGAHPLCMTRDEAAAFLKTTKDIAQTNSNERAPSSDQEETAKDLIEVWELVVQCDSGPYRIVVPHTSDSSSHGGMNIGKKFLVCEPYDGPEAGGYCVLNLIDVRGSVIGLAYASSIRDLHDASRAVGVKIVDSVLAAKRLGIYDGANEDEAMAMAKGPNGHMFRVPSGSKWESLDLGGIPKDALSGFDWLTQQQQKAAGNSAVLAGAGSIADTATESSIINSGQQQRTGEFYRKVLMMAKQVMRRIAWYEYFNPLARWNEQLSMQGVTIDVEYGPEMREGDQLDAFFEIGVNMVSVAAADPAMRLQRINEFLALLGTFMQYVPMGASIEGYMMVGRQELGMRSVDQLFPNPQAMQAMMMELQQQAGPPAEPGMKPARPPQYGAQPAAPRPGGAGAMTAAVQSAYSPAFR